MITPGPVVVTVPFIGYLVPDQEAQLRRLLASFSLFT
jgi:hypothetical protein